VAGRVGAVGWLPDARDGCREVAATWKSGQALLEVWAIAGSNLDWFLLDAPELQSPP
jgi:hypothetical protein